MRTLLNRATGKEGSGFHPYDMDKPYLVGFSIRKCVV